MLVTDPHFSLEREEQKKARRDEIRGLDTEKKKKDKGVVGQPPPPPHKEQAAAVAVAVDPKGRSETLTLNP